MRIEGIHHITAITGDAPRAVDFYAGLLGLRLVKRTVNQDDPSVYHLFFGDEAGHPGNDLTFFEYPGAQPGRAGAGMVHRIIWRVGSPDAVAYWDERLAGADVAVLRHEERIRFSDPEGLEHEIAVSDAEDEPLRARHKEVPPDYALQGFDGVRAYANDPTASASLLGESLGLHQLGGCWQARGERRQGTYSFDSPPSDPGLQGAGTVHHVAWAVEPDQITEWRQRVLEAGMYATEIIDRFYFRSVYFREPNGVLFELATIGPGFSADEDPEHLGERLSLPPDFEPLREKIEPHLTPLPDVRRWRPVTA